MGLRSEVTSEPAGIQPAADVDAAWKFLDRHRDARINASDIRAIRRKIDWHIVPLMFLCYTMQFFDKVILNVRSFSIRTLSKHE